MDANLLRRVNWLWKHRHTHTGGELDDLTDRLIVVETHLDGVVPNVNSGARIHLQATAGQTIPHNTATALSFNVLSPLGARNIPVPSFPTTAVQIVQGGYYNIGVELGWETPFVERWDVTVVLVRDGVEVQVYPDANSPDGVWGGTYGRGIREVAEAVPFQAGDKLKVYVNQESGESQNIDTATLAFYAVDRTGTEGPSASADIDSTQTLAPDSPWDLPTYIPGDLMYIAADAAGIGVGGWGTPDGWSLIGSTTYTDSSLYIFSKVMNGSEGSTITLDAPDSMSGGAAVAWRIRSSVDYSTVTPDIEGPLQNTATAPDITPSHGAARYWVFVVAGGSNFYGISGPSGFDSVETCDTSSMPGNRDPVMHVAMKDVVTSGQVSPGGWSAGSDAGTGRNVLTGSIMVKVGDL